MNSAGSQVSGLNAAAEKPDPRHGPPAKGGPRPRVLLVEDSNSDAYLVRLAIERITPKPEMTHFSDSEKALEWLSGVTADQAPDLLILDLNIPRKDGFEVLAALQRMPEVRDMPVMVLTSSISPEDRRRAAVAGVRRFLSKPMMLDDFLRAVGTAVAETIVEAQDGSVH